MGRKQMAVIRWIFRHLTKGHPPIFSVQCTACTEEPPTGYDTPNGPEQWALTHAAQTIDRAGRHTVYRMTITSFAEVLPHPEDANLLPPGQTAAVAVDWRYISG